MGVLLDLALGAFYRAAFADGAVSGTVSNFLELKWATAAVALVLWALLLATGRLPAQAPRPTAIYTLIALLVAWAALSLMWTPGRAVATLSGLYAGIGLIAYGLARLTVPAALVRLLPVAAGTLLLASLAADLLYGRAVDLGFGYENFAAEALVLCVGTMALAWPQRGMALRWPLLALGAVAALYLLVLAKANLQYLALLAGLWYLAMRMLPR